MQINIRKSALKGRKMKGFRRRMRTRAGRKIINAHRKIAAGKPKPFHRKNR